MNTIEMIKRASEKSLSKFLCKNEEDNYVHFKIGVLVWADSLVFEINTLSLTYEWEEEEDRIVSFIEAIKSGKKIRVEHEFIEKSLGSIGSGYNNLDDILYELGNHFNRDAVADILLTGKWYIE